MLARFRETLEFEECLNRQNFAKRVCKTTKFCNFAKERNLNDEKLMNVHQRIGLF